MYICVVCKDVYRCIPIYTILNLFICFYYIILFVYLYIIKSEK